MFIYFRWSTVKATLASGHYMDSGKCVCVCVCKIHSWLQGCITCFPPYCIYWVNNEVFYLVKKWNLWPNDSLPLLLLLGWIMFVCFCFVYLFASISPFFCEWMKFESFFFQARWWRFLQFFMAFQLFRNRGKTLFRVFF